MRVSRREFITTGGKSIVGGALLFGAASWLQNAGAPASSGVAHASSEGHEGGTGWRMVVDTRECIGCGRCVRACKLENDVPMEPEFSRTWVERYVVTKDEQVLVDSPEGGIHGFAGDHVKDKYGELDIRRSFFVPKLCNHCGSAPCVLVCPVGANYTTKEGAVLIDQEACIGCGYCIQACPFGARFFHPKLRIVDKCTWCYHRLVKGHEPACVYVCPVGARNFGDIGDPESNVSRMLSHNTASTLKQELGVEGRVYYIGLDNGVR